MPPTAKAKEAGWAESKEHFLSQWPDRDQQGDRRVLERERGQSRPNTVLRLFIYPPMLTNAIAPLASDSQKSPGEPGWPLY